MSAAVAGAHVEPAGARIRKQVEHRRVNLLEREGFVSGRQRGRVGVVAGYYVADGEAVAVGLGPVGHLLDWRFAR